MKGRKDADHGEHPSHHIVDGSTYAQRSARRPCHIGKPPHHLHHLVESRPVLVWAREKSLERTVDQGWVDCLEIIVAEPDLLHAARTKVLDQDVRARDQALGEIEALL